MAEWVRTVVRENRIDEETVQEQTARIDRLKRHRRLFGQLSRDGADGRAQYGLCYDGQALRSLSPSGHDGH